MDMNHYSINLPGISFQDSLLALLRSIRGWEQLSNFDKEYETKMFMQKIGNLFLEYFQFHIQDGKNIGEEFVEDLLWAVRLINEQL